MERLTEDRIDEAARVLAAAFHHDPLLEILSPDEGKRPAVGDWFMRVGLRYAMRYDQVWTTDDLAGVAIWLPPAGTPPSTLALLRAGMVALPVKAGLRPTATFLRVMPAAERLHAKVHGPHWYLMTLGTAPDRHGQGIGSQLLEAGVAQAEAAGLPCYLETGTESNVAFYEKRGFRAVGELPLGRHRLWGMVRQPSGA